jgi:hypothetical protein
MKIKITGSENHQQASSEYQRTTDKGNERREDNRERQRCGDIPYTE